VTLKGTVSKMEWYNPHTTLYVNVKNPDGTVVNWAVTFLPPHELTRQKITKETIAVGQEITIPVWLHKDHSRHAEAAPRSIVTLAGGTTIKMPDDLAANRQSPLGCNWSLRALVKMPTYQPVRTNTENRTRLVEASGLPGNRTRSHC